MTNQMHDVPSFSNFLTQPLVDSTRRDFSAIKRKSCIIEGADDANLSSVQSTATTDPYVLPAELTEHVEDQGDSAAKEARDQQSMTSKPTGSLPAPHLSTTQTAVVGNLGHKGGASEGENRASTIMSRQVVPTFSPYEVGLPGGASQVVLSVQTLNTFRRALFHRLVELRVAFPGWDEHLNSGKWHADFLLKTANLDDIEDYFCVLNVIPPSGTQANGSAKDLGQEDESVLRFIVCALEGLDTLRSRREASFVQLEHQKLVNIVVCSAGSFVHRAPLLHWCLGSTAPAKGKFEGGEVCVTFNQEPKTGVLHRSLPAAHATNPTALAQVVVEAGAVAGVRPMNGESTDGNPLFCSVVEKVAPGSSNGTVDVAVVTGALSEAQHTSHSDPEPARMRAWEHSMPGYEAPVEILFEKQENATEDLDGSSQSGLLQAEEQQLGQQSQGEARAVVSGNRLTTGSNEENQGALRRTSLSASENEHDGRVSEGEGGVAELDTKRTRDSVLVHSCVPDRDTFKVFRADRTTWSVTLQRLEVSEASTPSSETLKGKETRPLRRSADDTFFIMQLLQPSDLSTSSFAVFCSWGPSSNRVATSIIRKFNKLSDAKRYFEEAFEMKTGNRWYSSLSRTKSAFVPFKGKYMLLLSRQVEPGHVSLSIPLPGSVTKPRKHK